MKKYVQPIHACRSLWALLAVSAATLMFPFSPASAQKRIDDSAGTGAGSVEMAELERERDRPDAIQSIDEADRILADIRQRRSDIERTFAAEQQQCTERFFVSRCTDKAEERRRTALKPLRTMEAEANFAKRRYKVEQRDKALERRQSRERSVP